MHLHTQVNGQRKGSHVKVLPNSGGILCHFFTRPLGGSLVFPMGDCLRDLPQEEPVVLYGKVYTETTQRKTYCLLRVAAQRPLQVAARRSLLSLTNDCHGTLSMVTKCFLTSGR